MLRGLCMLLLGAGLALAQEGNEDEGISVDETPPGQEEREQAKPCPAREPGAKVETVAIRKRIYTIALPEDWVLISDDGSDAEVAWEVLLPGSTKRARLTLRRDTVGDPRSSPFYRAKRIRTDAPDVRTEVRQTPCPLVVCSRQLRGTDRVDAYFYRAILNNPYEIHLSCAASDFGQAEPDMLEAVRSFAADVELWPPIPKGYKASPQGAWLVATAPDVTASIAPIQKTLREEEHRFRQVHGSLPRSDAPLVVLVQASKSAGASIDPRVADSVFDCFADVWGHRVLAVPFEKDDGVKASQLAYVAHDVLLMAKYGDVRPGWIWAGECIVAQAEAATGKPLPNLDAGFVGWAKDLRLRLPKELDMDRPGYVSQESWPHECFFYVAALREGKYRPQYDAFLRDCAETYDCMGAFERHLGTIDERDLRASASDFISKGIKEVKRKEPRK